MASSYSDPHMQSVLDQLRRYSHTSQNSENNNITNSNSLGCPKITPCEKCLAPHAFSGAKFQV